ncbi:MAG TPA: phosphatidate cytidylyltransferase [Rhodocyclaceae bacterium]|nr:phosphatidate cytidylyltransferase [Rhodocyclaceae bacterium]
MLKARIITALALLAGFLCVLFLLPKPVVAVVFALVAALMAWEWGGLMHIDRDGRFLFVGFILISCLTAYNQADFAYPKLWWLSALFWLLLVPLWLCRRWRMSSNDMAGYAAGWILIVPTWAAMVSLHDRNPWLLFGAMALVWVADIAAYFAGRAWGRHKLAPAISPGKTWEGVVGAVTGVLVYGAAAAMVARYSPPGKLSWALLLVALTAVSIVGDLFESMVKRQADVKDSGNLLPGHGGLLDRLDSQTSTLPLAALILAWLQAS